MRTLVFGLGNPGDTYLWTRHNAGFLIIDALAVRASNQPLKKAYRKKDQGLICDFSHKNGSVMLIKPQTFMNRSGEVVRAFVDFYKSAPADVIVIHDDMDLEFGRLKIKQGGGEAGHNGLLSITEYLGTDEYGRIRFGIGRPVGAGADYVLSEWRKEERSQLPRLVDFAVEALMLVLNEGIQKAMNVVNSRKSGEPDGA